MDPQPPPPPPSTRVDNTLATTQNGERLLFNIRRHPIGLMGIYFSTAVLLIVTAVLCFIVPQHVVSSSGNHTMEIAGLVFVVVAVVIIIFLLITTKVYWGNRWILTTDSITQINQSSLFNRQSSQLSLGNLEDVTAEQNGPLAHLLNFGLLKVETASETGKFIFAYCPNPNYYAQQVLAAREAFEQAIAASERPAAVPTPAIPYPQDPLQPPSPAPVPPPVMPSPQSPSSVPESSPHPDDSPGVNSNSQ